MVNIEKQSRGIGSEIPKKSSIRTGSVDTLIELVKITDGKSPKIFKANIGTKEIPSKGDEKQQTTTRFLIKISSIEQKVRPEEKETEIVLVKFVGERKNSSAEIFEDANIEMHKKGLKPNEKIEEIKKMPHFEETRKMLLKSIDSTEKHLKQIEEELHGAKGTSALRCAGSRQGRF